MALGLLVSLALVAEKATGQALELVFDLSTPATEISRYNASDPADVSPGLAFGLGYYSRPALEEGDRLRLGVLVGRRALRVSQSGSFTSEYDYSEFRIQGRAAVDILRSRNVAVCGEVALGLSFMSDNVPCNEMFCELPGTAIIATPCIRTNLRVSQRVSALVEYKYSAYLDEPETTYPFKSGSVLAIGIEVSARKPKATGSDF